MAVTIATAANYWISPNALSITRNALGEPNRIQASVAGGSVIICYIRGIKAADPSDPETAKNGDGLEYDNGHNYRRWPLIVSPTYFNSNTEKYLYVAIPRKASTGTDAMVVFPSVKLDIYGYSIKEAPVKDADGKMHDKDGNETDDPTKAVKEEQQDELIGSEDYFYIWLQGILSSSGDSGTTEREWLQKPESGTLNTDEAISSREEDWYRWDGLSQSVTFLKEIWMDAASIFRNLRAKILILNGHTLNGVAVKGVTPDDSNDTIVTPSYINGKYLRKDRDDSTPYTLGVGNLNVNVGGRVKTNDIESHNYSGDSLADTGWKITNSYNGHSKLTIDEIYVRMKAVFESLEVRERTYTGGDQIWSCAGNYVNRTDYMGNDGTTHYVDENGVAYTDPVAEDDEAGQARARQRAQEITESTGVALYETPVAGETFGYSRIQIPWMLNGIALVLGVNNRLVRGLFAHYKSVKITLKRSASRGKGGTGTETDEQIIRKIRRVRCYFLAKDGERSVHNWWRINDLARCQTMNLENINRETYLEETTTKAGNVFWWRKVIDVSYNPVKLEDGKWYHYFDVAFNSLIEESTDPAIHATMATFAMEGSDIPAAADSVVQFGNTINPGRMNLMMMEVNGGDVTPGYAPSADAPCLKAYKGIYCFDLNKCWTGGKPCKMKLSPSNDYEFYGPSIKFVTEYDVVPVPIERPEIYWTNIGRNKDASGNWTNTWTFEGDAYPRAEVTPYSDDQKTGRNYAPYVDAQGHVRAGAPVRKCYYYEKVSHNGCYFICSIVDGAHWEAEETFSYGGRTYTIDQWMSDSDYNALPAEYQGRCKRVPNYTIEEPSATSQDWTMTVSSGAEPIAVYKWAQKESMTPQEKPTITAAQWAAWTDGSTPINGWTKNAPNRPTTDPETWYLFQSQSKLYADGSIDSWSTPTRISGAQGTPGEDAEDTEWIYIRNDSKNNPGDPNSINNGTIPDPSHPGQRIPSTDKTKDDWVPNGWSDNALEIAWNNKYVWASFRTKARGANTDPSIQWGEWSTPIIWSHWGQNGMDGDGVEYVYIRTKNSVSPIVAYNNNINRSYTKDGKTVTYLDDEFLPVISNNDPTKTDTTKAWAESNTCTDDPSGISRDWPFEWCLSRKMTAPNAETGKRTWHCYGGEKAGDTEAMALWDHYGENAIRLDIDNEMDSVQTDSLGKILSTRVVRTVVRLWDGAGEADISAVDFTAEGRISGGPASTVAQFSQAASGKGKQLSWTFPAGNSITTAYEIIISYVYLNVTHRCTFTITASMGQAVYQLKPSLSSLPCTVKSDNTYNNPPALPLSVVKIDGASTTEITELDNTTGGTIEGGEIFIRYSLDSMPTGKTAGREWPSAGSTKAFGTVQATSDKANVYIAMFNASGTLLDRETIPVVKNGLNGENAIRLDLDNENDSMLYTGDGTLVSGSVTSTAYMFDGAGDVSGSTTFSIVGREGCTSSQATISGRVITVTGISAAKAKVTVQGVYTDGHGNTHTKTAVLTIKKIVDGDKYDLVITPNSIAYNVTTDTPATSTIAIQVWKISVNSSGGVTRALSAPPTGYAVYAGSTALSASGTGTYSHTTDNSAISEVLVKIAKTTDLNDILDAETISVNKAENGKSITKSSEVREYQVSASGTTIPTGTWLPEAQKPTPAQNQYLWTRTTITWSDNSTTVLYSAERNPNDGQPGQSITITSQTITYSKQSAGNLDPTTLSYGGYPSSLAKGDWLYSKTTVNYSDNTHTDSYSVSYIGTDGDTGRGIRSVVEEYAVNNDANNAPATSAFSTTFPSTWGENNRYIWNREVITYTKGTPATETTTPRIKAIWTKDGKGIDSIVNRYLTNNVSDGITKANYKSYNSGNEWPTTVTPTTSNNPYLWNFEVITYTDGSSEMTDPHVVGHYGKDGTNGSDAVNVIVTPSSLIVNQDLQNTSNLSNLSETVIFTVEKGASQLSVSSVSVTDMNRCYAMGSSNNYATLKRILTDGTNYYDTADFTCTVTYSDNGITRTVSGIKVRVYANLLGTWKQSVENGVSTEVGRQINYGLQDGGVIKTAYDADIEKSAKQMRSEYTEQISRAGDYDRNLFGFLRGLVFGASDEDPVPFVQGYGLVFRGRQDGVRGGRISNIGLQGTGGEFTVTCQMKLTSALSTAAVMVEMCNVTNTRGKGSVPAGSDYVTVSTAWQNFEFHIDIPSDNEYLNTLNGFLDFQGNWNSGPYIYVRHLSIQRGEKADFVEADEDITYTGMGNLVKSLSNDGGMTPDNYPVETDNVQPGYQKTVVMSSITTPTQNPKVDLLSKNDFATIESGKVYTLSFWARSTVAGMVMSTHLHPDIITNVGGGLYYPTDGSGKPVNGEISEGVASDGYTDIRLSTSWKQYFVHYYIGGETAVRSLIPLRIYKNNNQGITSSTIYIAGIEFQEGFVMNAGIFNSLVEQNARRITLMQQTGLKKAGINIENGTITLDAENTVATGNFYAPQVISENDDMRTIIRAGQLRIESKKSKSYGEFMINSLYEIVLRMYDSNGAVVASLGGTPSAQASGRWVHEQMKPVPAPGSHVYTKSELTVNSPTSSVNPSSNYYKLELGVLRNGSDIQYFLPPGTSGYGLETRDSEVIARDDHMFTGTGQTDTEIKALSYILDGWYVKRNDGSFLSEPTIGGEFAYCEDIYEFYQGVQKSVTHVTFTITD